MKSGRTAGAAERERPEEGSSAAARDWAQIRGRPQTRGLPKVPVWMKDRAYLPGQAPELASVPGRVPELVQVPELVPEPEREPEQEAGEPPAEKPGRRKNWDAR